MTQYVTEITTLIVSACTLVNVYAPGVLKVLRKIFSKL